MTVTALREFFKWCTIINGALVIIGRRQACGGPTAT